MNKRLLSFLLGLVVAVGVAPRASAGDHHTPSHAIKAYAFSADTFEKVRAELTRQKLTFSVPLEPPTPGHSRVVQGVGPSGIPTYWVMEKVSGRFHVYTERRRPQQPMAPLPYVEQEVIFDTPDPAVSPLGTLTLPKGEGPFPGVVLVAGTGAHTRDAGMSLHKMLWVLADHLTRKGFAVLRYDKRGVGLTGGKAHPGSTTDEYAVDALAAVRFLQIQPKVDPAQVGVVGHSEGGIIAGMVASQAPKDVRFIVLLGGTGLPGLENQLLQEAAMARAEGAPEPLLLAEQSLHRAHLADAASPRPREEVIAAMQAVTAALPAETKTLLEIPAEGLPPEAFEGLLTPWFRRFLALDPRTYLEQVKCPVLALIGDKDLQVPANENLPAIEAALVRGGNRHAKVLRLPRLNHAFQTATRGTLNEYLLISETIAPSALNLVSTWMQEVVGVGR